MPTPKKYNSAAERKAAYRNRTKQALASLGTAKGLPAGAAIPTIPSYHRWNALLQNARMLLQTARDEMDAYTQERSDAWQQAERAEQTAANIEAIQEALSALDNISLGR
jgi:hypothetical protein